MNIHKNLAQLVGNTPMLELSAIGREENLSAKLVAKLEFMNPLGSIKDRTALAMIDDGEKRGVITNNTVIIEPTSGNTGVGLAFVCATRGYRLILTMPETMSMERRMLLEALGAEIHLTPGPLAMSGAIAEAQRLCGEIGDAFMPAQFDNPANPAIHQQTTGEEIWRDTGGTVDFLVASFGTGGTITGIGRALKAHKPQVKIIGVEPAASAVVSGGKAGAHKIQGIGAGFVPKVLDVDLMDEVIPVTNDAAYKRTAQLARQEGLLCGISSGAALDAAIGLAKRPENEGQTIVIILPDTGERYLSTGVFQK